MKKIAVAVVMILLVVSAGIYLLNIPAIDEQKLIEQSTDFVKTSFSDAATQAESKYVAEDADALQDFMKIRQAWLAKDVPKDFKCQSFKVDTQEVQRKYLKKSVIVSLSTTEIYTSESNASYQYGVGCSYRLYMEPRGDVWKITKAIADDRAGCHFFPQFFSNPLIFDKYDFDTFDSDIEEIKESLSK